MWNGQYNEASTSYGIFTVTPSLERWPAKVKEAPSLHEVRMTLLETNTIFLSFRDN